MRKIVTWDVMTLDGYFEGVKPWDLGFHDTVWGEELKDFSLEQAKDIGTILFGRKTYEGMAAYWSKEKGATADFMNSVDKVVVSDTQIKTPWNNSRQLDTNFSDAIRTLKNKPGKDIYVFGSAYLTSELLKHKFVDEIRICLAPIILGAGNPLFKSPTDSTSLELLETRQLKTGGVILRYKVAAKGKSK